jgi:hypothetical protein
MTSQTPESERFELALRNDDQQCGVAQERWGWGRPTVDGVLPISSSRTEGPSQDRAHREAAGGNPGNGPRKARLFDVSRPHGIGGNLFDNLFFLARVDPYNFVAKSDDGVVSIVAKPRD